MEVAATRLRAALLATAIAVGVPIVSSTEVSATPHTGTLQASLTHPSPSHWKCGGEGHAKPDGTK